MCYIPHNCIYIPLALCVYNYTLYSSISTINLVVFRFAFIGVSHFFVFFAISVNDKAITPFVSISLESAAAQNHLSICIAKYLVKCQTRRTPHSVYKAPPIAYHFNSFRIENHEQIIKCIRHWFICPFLCCAAATVNCGIEALLRDSHYIQFKLQVQMVDQWIPMSRVLLSAERLHA